MRGDQCVVVEQLDLREGGPDPEPLANQAMRRGVVGTGEDDVAIAMELGSFPLHQFPRREWQAEQRGPFELIEQLQGRALDRAVNPPPSRLDDPAEEMTIAIVHI